MPSLESLVILLLVGAIAGWLAGLVMKGRGFGLLGNIIIGILGAFFGSWLFGSVLGIAIGGTLISSIIWATLGAIVLLFIIGLIKKA